MIPFLMPMQQGTRVITPSSETFQIPGTYNFTIPDFNVLTVEGWAGGGSGALHALSGNEGGYSAFLGPTTVIAYGGKGGVGGKISGTTQYYYTAGAGGTATNGDTNTTGSSGTNGGTSFVTNIGKGANGTAGESTSGGTGGAGLTALPSAGSKNGNAGTAPGAGGSGGYYRYYSNYWGAGAGAGGYFKKVFYAGQFTYGQVIQVVVGAGGAPASWYASSIGKTIYSGAGGDGRIEISWE